VGFSSGDSTTKATLRLSSAQSEVGGEIRDRPRRFLPANGLSGWQLALEGLEFIAEEQRALRLNCSAQSGLRGRSGTSRMVSILLDGAEGIEQTWGLIGP